MNEPIEALSIGMAVRIIDAGNAIPVWYVGKTAHIVDEVVPESDAPVYMVEVEGQTLEHWFFTEELRPLAFEEELNAAFHPAGDDMNSLFFWQTAALGQSQACGDALAENAKLKALLERVRDIYPYGLFYMDMAHQVDVLLKDIGKSLQGIEATQS